MTAVRDNFGDLGGDRWFGAGSRLPPVIRDLIEGAPLEAPTADVCVVGAGAAGIILAVELARQGKRVLLVDGGGRDVEAASQDPYRSEIAGLRHNGIHDGRFRANGGSTTRWGGQILELGAEDFSKRHWVRGSGWPFPKDTLTPFYARAIELEGLSDATLRDDEVWKEIGVAPPAVRDFEIFFSRWLTETNFARLFRQQLEGNPLMTVWLHANAIAPIVDGARVTGIRCKTLTGVEQVFHGEHFVWCMGGIESSRFFLQPELGAMPWNRSGLLGRHYQDHIHSAAGEIELEDAKGFHRIFNNVFSKGFKYQMKMKLSLEEQERLGTLNVAANPVYVSDSDAVGGELKGVAKKLLRGKIRETSAKEIVSLITSAPLLMKLAWSYNVKHRAYLPANARIVMGIECEQEPETGSTIQLAQTRDALGLLRTRIDWKISDLEVHSIQSCVRAAADSLKGLARVVEFPELRNDTERFRRERCSDSNHHMGGMRMATAPGDGLVDPNLKLHGMENGYVCSAAVFPCSGFSNPTHTVIALAIRLADHLSAKIG